MLIADEGLCQDTGEREEPVALEGAVVTPLLLLFLISTFCISLLWEETAGLWVRTLSPQCVPFPGRKPVCVFHLGFDGAHLQAVPGEQPQLSSSLGRGTEACATPGSRGPSLLGSALGLLCSPRHPGGSRPPTASPGAACPGGSEGWHSRRVAQG